MLGWERQVDAVREQRVFDRRQHPVPRIERLSLRRIGNPPTSPKNDRGVPQFDDNHVWLGFCEDSRDGTDRLSNEALGTIDVVAIADSEVVLDSHQIVRRVHDDLLCEEIGIRNDDPAAVVGFQKRRTSLDVFDRSLERTGYDLVPQTERMGKEDQNSCEKVLKNISKGEADGDAGYAEQLDEITRMKTGERNGEGHQEAKNQHGASRESLDHEARTEAPEPTVG